MALLKQPIAVVRQPIADSQQPQSTEAGQLALMLLRMNAPADSASALADLADLLPRWLGCERVAIGLSHSRGKTCRLEALSGGGRIDRRSETVQLLECALDETLDQRLVIAWPPADDQTGAALTYRRAAAAIGCSGMMGTPLADHRGRTVGALLALGDAEWADRAAVANRMRAGARLIAGHVALVRRAHTPVARRLLHEGFAAFRRRKTQLGATAILAMAILLFIPVPYRLTCDCVIEPVVRRHIVAPFEGRLASTLVAPGDLVTAGQPLAWMDEREITWELTGLTAEHEQAKKRYDAALASRNAGASQVALLEMQQLEAKIRVLEARRDQLTIQSPIAGVVTRGDLKRSEGAPLSVGQSLFEVAPLEEMVVEVAIPESEIDHFQPGAAVTVRLDAFAGQSWSGALERIHPRAEIRDEANVFLGELHIANAQDQLRPGMQGRAKLVGPRRTLGWIWLHRPWNALRRRLQL